MVVRADAPRRLPAITAFYVRDVTAVDPCIAQWDMPAGALNAGRDIFVILVIRELGNKVHVHSFDRNVDKGISPPNSAQSALYIASSHLAMHRDYRPARRQQCPKWKPGTVQVHAARATAALDAVFKVSRHACPFLEANQHMIT
jgi:hypothetical protein